MTDDYAAQLEVRLRLQAVLSAAVRYDDAKTDPSEETAAQRELFAASRSLLASGDHPPEFYVSLVADAAMRYVNSAANDLGIDLPAELLTIELDLLTKITDDDATDD
ncbi:hypothetical protein [Microbacterium allomyrinae]|uniref:Uncharacterized protein n=1 Tax=Microbacterium allomyrinae TaxID=2830666 RepID=A0A9X1LUE6_9MICO|nr:hypothetical protein [Microbacterium allomyrinae]MCC2032199.1 hypothetical protein [Microbacterium allomyrinae]